MAWNILRDVSLQFTGIFYLHLPSYSSLAKTWLSIRNRISPVLYVLYIPLYRMIDCCFRFLSQNRLTTNKRASISRNLKSRPMRWYDWFRAQATQAGTYASRISLLRSHNKFIASNEERKTPDWFRLTAIFLDSWFSVYLTIIRRRRS